MSRTDVAKVARVCPACHSSASVPGGLKASFEILSCQECGTIYTSTLPARSSAQNYDGYYTSANLAVPEFTCKMLDGIIGGFEEYRLEGRLLEVGFGAGSFLQAAARAAWHVEGVEVSKTACEHGRVAGFKTFCGELSEARYPEGSFDVVIASELLEHVPDPTSILREVVRIVRPGGLFWATTPNAKGLSSRLLGLDWSVLSPPEHLHLFSAPGLKRLLRDVGFRRVQIVTQGLNPFELVKKFRRQETNKVASSDCGSERVSSGYRLNEALVKSAPRKAAKNFLNRLLRNSHLGDSLKIWAER